MRKTIEKLLKSPESTYAIAKGANVPYSTLSDLRTGKTSIDKMALLTAEKLYNYAKEK
ncbi:DNA-binding protein [Streptococcus anginosus]|uniref:DNA-binding protein n=1 Tax=Streptococcus anginosus TaxID=1328 RepID=UPI0030814794|nr:DNA-binding protein [Streptococcus anginosus]